MILLIDNYDSFTYNLVQRIGELKPDIDMKIVRNDKITPAQALKLKPSHVIVSPGPCSPNEAGVSNQIIAAFRGKVPVFGVCLGHQCIGHSHGMTVTRNYRLMHGKTSLVHHDGRTIFRGLSNPFVATRYHSLVILREGFDHERFEISAWTEEGEIMAVRAKPLTNLANSTIPDDKAANAFGPAPLEGVQFHPESFLTVEGPIILANFLGLPAPALQTAAM